MLASNPRPISASAWPCKNKGMKTLSCLLALVSTVAASAQIGADTPPPSERRSDLGSFLRSGLQAFTGNQQSSQISLQQLTQNWNATARQAAKEMFDKYGAPQEVTANRLVWRDNRPWKSTTVVNQDVRHNFPAAHNDVLIQTLAIDVPVERFTQLAQFDGSVTASRTNGELVAACDREEHNFIALNLANDIIAGNLSVPQARQRLAELTAAVKSGQQPAYASGIRFSLPVSSRTGDPDGPDNNRRRDRDWQQIGW